MADKVPVPTIEVIAERGVFLTKGYQKNRRAIASQLDKIKDRLKPLIKRYRARIEEKEASVVFHVRNVPKKDKERALNEAIIATEDKLKEGRFLQPVFGRMTVEFQPKNLPDKGDAIQEVIKRYGKKNLFIYVGDDAADEPAFKKIGSNGFGILVKSKEKDYRKTSAKYTLNGIAEVQRFLDMLHVMKTAAEDLD